MQMLYDSDSFVVMHLQAEPQESKNAQDALKVVMQGVPLADIQRKDEERDSAAKPEYRLARHGFEIVDKRSGKEVYLDGSWAELFQQHLSAWQLNTPSQEEVEETIEKYAQLAQTPVVLH
jgi:hypothetical protein